jgi:hypothetical protein
MSCNILTCPIMDHSVVTPYAPARQIPHNKRRFNWGVVSSGPAYAISSAKLGRRARAGISKHVSHFRDRSCIGNKTPIATNCQRGATFLGSGPRTVQCNGQLLKGQLRRIPALTFADVESKFMELPRQGRPLLLGEGSGCVHDADHPAHASSAHGHGSLVQPLTAHSVQIPSAAIPLLRTAVEYPLLHAEGDNDDGGAHDVFASLQCFGSYLPVSDTKSPLVANMLSTGGHSSLCPSFGFVALHGCCAPVLAHPLGTCSHGDDKSGVDRVCGGFRQPSLVDLMAIRIPSMKLVCVNQLHMGTSAEPWVYGHVLENYTCLSSGRDLYDVEFGVSYGRQTVLVGDCELLCDGEDDLHCFETVFRTFLQSDLQGDDMTFPDLGPASHGTPPLVDAHGMSGVYHTPIFLCFVLLCVHPPISIVCLGICL